MTIRPERELERPPADGRGPRRGAGAEENPAGDVPADLDELWSVEDFDAVERLLGVFPSPDPGWPGREERGSG